MKAHKTYPHLPKIYTDVWKLYFENSSELMVWNLMCSVYQ